MQKYIKLSKSVLSLSLDAKAIKCYAYICAVIGANKGRAARLSIAAIARGTALSESSVCRALKGLEARELILRSKTYIGKVRCADRFRHGRCRPTGAGFLLLDTELLIRFNPEKLLIYLVLCSHANSQGYAYLSERRLAAETGLSRNTVRKYASEHERECTLERYSRFYKKHRDTLARRCFAYRIGDVEDIIDLTDPTRAQDTQIEASLSFAVDIRCIYTYVSLHPERVIPLRVPP